MKKKSIAVTLAFLFGWIGTHRFYLDQRFRGIMHFIFGAIGIIAFATDGNPFILFPLLISVIDTIVFATMSRQEFDEKYNSKRKPYGHRRDSNKPGSSRQTYISSTTRGVRKDNPFKSSGIEKYKDYDFSGAIADFEKALGIHYEDPAVHFNLACAYSITEKLEKSIFHLSKSVEFGFVDFDRMHSHEDLAFVRSHDEFDSFVANGYQITPALPADSGSFLDNAAQDASFNNLLEEIRALGELRKKGYITEDEFDAEKQRILNKRGE